VIFYKRGHDFVELRKCDILHSSELFLNYSENFETKKWLKRFKTFNLHTRPKSVTN